MGDQDELSEEEPDDSDEADEVELAEELALLLGKHLLHLLPQSRDPEKGIIPGKRPGAVSSPVPRVKCISRVIKISSASVNFPSRREVKYQPLSGVSGDRRWLQRSLNHLVVEEWSRFRK